MHLKPASTTILSAAVLWLATGPIAATHQAAGTIPSAVFVVRHAERADAAPATAQPSMTAPMSARGADPPLSPAGEARAERLAAMLREAGITRIFTTEFARTRQTAQPLASRAGVEVTVIAADDIPALVRRLKEPGGPALVVGHSNTVPEILKALGITEPIRIADTEYDNLFIAVPASGTTGLLKLKF